MAVTRVSYTPITTPSVQPRDLEAALDDVGDGVARRVAHVLVDDDVATHGCLPCHEIVRDEQETAAVASRLLRRKTYPPDHVESVYDAEAPSSVRPTVKPVGVLAMVIVTSWASAAPAATSADGVRLSMDREVAPRTAAAASGGDLPGRKDESVSGPHRGPAGRAPGGR